jgi:hypothetical protein
MGVSSSVSLVGVGYVYLGPGICRTSQRRVVQCETHLMKKKCERHASLTKQTKI